MTAVTIAIAVTGFVGACNVAVVMLGYSYKTAKLRAQETAKEALGRPYCQRRCLARHQEYEGYAIVQRTPPRTCSRAMRHVTSQRTSPKLPELLERSESALLGCTERRLAASGSVSAARHKSSVDAGGRSAKNRFARKRSRNMLLKTVHAVLSAAWARRRWWRRLVSPTSRPAVHLDSPSRTPVLVGVPVRT